MAMLNGALKATGGKALINGTDIEDDSVSARSSMGFCPQQNVLFEELTVSEHIEFFSVLKGSNIQDAKKETEKYVRLLNLKLVENALVSTLSNTLKRSLQLAIALCADSKVLLIDEVTSGMDSTTQHFIWDLLENEKYNRTILLSTHEMDEADAIGDRIAVLVDGSLQCCGTPSFLKKRFDTGCRLICTKGDGCVSSDLTFMALQNFFGTEMRIHMEDEDEIVYQLPYDHYELDRFLSRFEQNKHHMKVKSFRLAFTTMEEVFVQIDKMNRTNDKQDSNDAKLDGDPRQIFHTNEKYFLTGRALLANHCEAMITKRRMFSWKSFKSYVYYNIFVLFVLGSVYLLTEFKPSRNTEWPALPITIDTYTAPKVIIDDANSNRE